MSKMFKSKNINRYANQMSLFFFEFILPIFIYIVAFNQALYISTLDILFTILINKRYKIRFLKCINLISFSIKGAIYRKEN